MSSREIRIYEKGAKDAAYVDAVRKAFTEHLREKGLRLTPQREAILQTLLSADRHLSEEEIYERLKGGGLGRVTVFRTLKMLQEAGIVESVAQPDGRKRYEIHEGRPHHDHLVCVECGAIIEVRWGEVEQIQERACRKLGFEPLYHRHEVFGRCAECRGRGKG